MVKAGASGNLLHHVPRIFRVGRLNKAAQEERALGAQNATDRARQFPQPVRVSDTVHCTVADHDALGAITDRQANPTGNDGFAAAGNIGRPDMANHGLGSIDSQQGARFRCFHPGDARVAEKEHPRGCQGVYEHTRLGHLHGAHIFRRRGERRPTA